MRLFIPITEIHTTSMVFLIKDKKYWFNHSKFSNKMVLAERSNNNEQGLIQQDLEFMEL